MGFGDGATETGASVAHAYADNGSYSVSLVVDDGDGGSDTSGMTAIIANVAPVLGGTPDTSVTEDDAYVFTPTASDPGTADTLVWSSTLPTAATMDASSGSVSWSPTWRDLGPANFLLALTDDDGASASLAWTVDVEMRDADGDGISDGWENDFGYDASDPADASADDDADGRSLADEWQARTQPDVYDGPSAPGTASPADGDESATATPTLTVSPAVSPLGDALTYEYELYADEEMTTLLTTTSGEGERWTENLSLDENTWKFWRARAADAYVSGPWSDLAGFFVNVTNEPPSAPGIRTPRDGTTVATVTPTLEIDPSTDVDLDGVTYTYSLVEGTSEREGGVAATEWQPAAALTDGAEYCWNAVATDEHGLTGATSETACFIVDTANQPPTAPVVVSPEDGLAVLTTEPIVTITDGVDPEGRQVLEVLQFSPDASYPVDQTTEVNLPTDGSGTTSWTAPALPDATWWYLRVLTSDGAAESAWVEFSIYVDATNTAPEPPVLESPADDASLVPDDGFVLYAANPSDADGILRIDFVLMDADGAPLSRASIPSDGSGGASWVVGSLADETYSWSARAVDTRLAASAWAVPGQFEIASNANDGVHAVGDDCGCAAGSSSGGLSILIATMLAKRRRRI